MLIIYKKNGFLVDTAVALPLCKKVLAFCCIAAYIRTQGLQTSLYRSQLRASLPDYRPEIIKAHLTPGRSFLFCEPIIGAVA